MRRLVILIRLYLVPVIIVSLSVALYYAIFVVIYNKDTDLTHTIKALYGEDKHSDKVIATNSDESPVDKIIKKNSENIDEKIPALKDNETLASNETNHTPINNDDTTSTDDNDNNKVATADVAVPLGDNNNAILDKANGAIKYKVLMDVEVHERADLKSKVLEVKKTGSTLSVASIQDDWLHSDKGWIYNSEDRLAIIQANIYAGVEKQDAIKEAKTKEDNNNKVAKKDTNLAQTLKVEQPKEKLEKTLEKKEVPILAEYRANKRFNIRAKATVKSDILGKLNRNEEVYIVNKIRKWGELKRGGYIYLDKRFVTKISDGVKLAIKKTTIDNVNKFVKFDAKYRVISGTLRVREKPTVKSNVVAILHHNALIPAYHQHRRWIEISKDMWVYNSDRFIKKVDNDSVMELTTDSALNIRKKPILGSNKVAIFDKDDTLESPYMKNNFYKTDKGYIYNIPKHIIINDK